MNPLIFKKGGVEVTVIAQFHDLKRVITKEKKIGGVEWLPCRCGGLIVACTCRIRDHACRRCGRVFASYHGEVYEIEDPHGANAKS